MNESSEFLGSMPSTPALPPVKRPPSVPLQAQATGVATIWTYVGFFLWGAILAYFPAYARMDDLGAGVDYGVAAMLFFIALVGALNILFKRSPGQNAIRASQARTSRASNWLNGVLVGAVLFVLGIYLNILDIPSLGDTSLIGIFLCIAGMVIGVLSLSRYITSKLAARTQVDRGNGSVQAQRQTNTLGRGIYTMCIGIVILLYARLDNFTDLVRGISYGIGLFFLVGAILSITSYIGRHMAKRQASQ